MITIEMLEGACKEQKELWQKEWPNDMAVTVKNVTKALALKLDINWFINDAFSASQRAEYFRIHAPAQATYMAIFKLSCSDFIIVKDAAKAKFDRARAAAFVKVWMQC